MCGLLVEVEELRMERFHCLDGMEFIEEEGFGVSWFYCESLRLGDDFLYVKFH